MHEIIVYNFKNLANKALSRLKFGQKLAAKCRCTFLYQNNMYCDNPLLSLEHWSSLERRRSNQYLRDWKVRITAPSIGAIHPLSLPFLVLEQLSWEWCLGWLEFLGSSISACPMNMRRWWLEMKEAIGPHIQETLTARDPQYITIMTAAIRVKSFHIVILTWGRVLITQTNNNFMKQTFRFYHKWKKQKNWYGKLNLPISKLFMKVRKKTRAMISHEYYKISTKASELNSSKWYF